MNMKKFGKLSFTAVLAMGIVLAGCSSDDGNSNESNVNQPTSEASKKPVTIKIAAKTHPIITKKYEDMAIMKQLAAETGLNVEWDVIPTQGYEERKNLILASSDLPDAFFGAAPLSDYDLLTFGSQGVLLPLEDLIAEHAPNIQKVLDSRPQYAKAITAPDGHIYSVPKIEEQDLLYQHDTLFINKAWLDKLGLPVPQTIEEFESALQAFKDKDPNGNGSKDEIPFTFIYNELPRHGIYSMFGAFGMLDNPDHFVIQDGKPTFTAVQPQYKDAIGWFHQLFGEGLIDPESFTQDLQLLNSKTKSETPLVGAYLGWDTVNYIHPDHAADYVKVAPLKGPAGVQLWNKYDSALTRSAFSITSENPDPAATMEWLDAVYEPENSLQMAFGPFDINLKKNDDGSYEYLPTPEGKPYGEFRHFETPGSQAPYAVLRETFDKLAPNDAVKAKTENYKFYEPYMPEAIYPMVFFGLEDIEQLNILKTDIYDLVNKSQAKWIINGLSDSDWSSYMNQLNKMGLGELESIYTDNYNRYQSMK